MSVSAGLPVQKSERVWKVTNPTFSSNTYIVSTAPGEGFVVDPGLDVALIDAAIESLSLSPSRVFCTHAHFDHIGSASFIQKKYGAKVYLHTDDLKTLSTCNFLLMAFKLPHRIESPRLEQVTGSDVSVPLADGIVRYIATPGHTPGSCVIRFGDEVFTGDTLYSRGMALSRLPGEDSEGLRASLRAIWDAFPPESRMHPGHGDSASFGWIKQHNRKLLRFVGVSESQTSGSSA